MVLPALLLAPDRRAPSLPPHLCLQEAASAGILVEKMQTHLAGDTLVWS